MYKNKNVSSDLTTLKYGIPQGLIFGPCYSYSKSMIFQMYLIWRTIFNIFAK